ncbi:MAG: putative bifunctional diguanylate cyclase/phosphodiesterase [Acidimicrobiia bacterium]
MNTSPPPEAVPGMGDILIVDDDEGTCDTLVDILQLSGYAARSVGTAGDALAARDSAPPVLAVIDYRLPDATGLELAARLKRADRDLPVIVLTGNASLETAVAAVGQVDDYLTKPVVPETFLRAVRAGLERRHLVSENRDLLARLQQANLTLETRVRERTEALAHQALHDTLTGLPNRALLVDRLDQALAGSARTGCPVAILFIDVDHFKLFNDSRGHAAGDELLVAVARRLRQIVRPADTVARFGGDEFVVVSPDGGTVQGATVMAGRIATSLGLPFRLGEQDVFLTVSIGLAISEAVMSAEALLRDADAAMYRAKQQGRARCEFFDETMRTEAAARLDLQTALHWAIERSEMRVFYQPLVEVASGRVVGLEGLVRWDHPERGILSPASFVPVAEEAGLIVPIDESVLRQAVADHSRWRVRHPHQPLSMAVNLSAHHLRNPGLAGRVEAVLEEYGMDASALCVELTESVLMEDLDRHAETLLDLRGMGVRIAIDDFGTGYSSLTYLRRFPVDVVKIDRSFVAGLGTDPRDTAIVRGVIELAHALDLVVVAEGIERPEQLEELLLLRCDLAQGYLFAPPEPAAIVDGRLAGELWPPAAGRPAPVRRIPVGM